jgi:hypothetical protein
MTDYKQLCADLLQAWEAAPTPSDFIDTDGYGFFEKLRTALAEDEPGRQSTLANSHYEWELEDDEGEWQAGGSANSFEDVQREGMRYLQTYAQEGFHRLIIRHHCTRVIQEINNA